MKQIQKLFCAAAVAASALACLLHFGVPAIRRRLTLHAARRQFRIGGNKLEASSIGIIGGADGPTAIYVSSAYDPDWFEDLAVKLGVGSAAAALLTGLCTAFRAGKIRRLEDKVRRLRGM